MYKNYDFESFFSEKVGKIILSKLKKTKIEMLKDVFYCFAVVDTGSSYKFGIKMTPIDKKHRKQFENKILKTDPCVFAKTGYSYQECYIRMLKNCYAFRGYDNHFFNEDDEQIYNELIEYIVRYNVAPEIFNILHSKYFDLKSCKNVREIFEGNNFEAKIADIEQLFTEKNTLVCMISRFLRKHPSTNMRKFSHLDFDENSFIGLETFDSVVDFFADCVIKIATENPLLVLIDKYQLKGNFDFIENEEKTKKIAEIFDYLKFRIEMEDDEEIKIRLKNALKAFNEDVLI